MVNNAHSSQIYIKVHSLNSWLVHRECEKKKYHFTMLWKYLKIFLWWGCIICGLHVKSQQISHTFNVVFSVVNVQWLILLWYELSSVPSHFHFLQHCPQGTEYYHQLTMTQNFHCFFLLDIFFLFVLHFLFLYNKCPQVYIHHGRFLVLCVIRSLLGRF